MSNVVVVAEVRAGRLKRASLEAVTAAKELAAQTGGRLVAVASGGHLAAAAAELASAGAATVVAVEGAGFAQYTGDGYAKAVAEQVKKADAAVAVMTHT